MSLINQVLAEDVSISSLPNPATNITKFNIAGLLQGNGLDVINFIFILVGLGFFANLIFVGWSFLMSSGDPKKIATASTRLINGFVGLVMAIVAFVIVRIVTNILGLGNLV